MHRRLRNESLRDFPMNYSEESVLAQLYQQPRQTGAELARFQRITPQSMTKIVAHLVKQGWVEKGKNPHDKRRKELFLTGEGRAQVEAINQARERWILDKADEVIDPAEYESLLYALKTLKSMTARADPKLMRE
ncbi:MAG: MarR family transcriptional regulator [Rothia sp. (in: high G+C Gram-positive bacteria)]|nr:MarR family transcriptional regulator [Rothia sp. (in: high G+C Gram-positive bacteria)]